MCLISITTLLFRDTYVTGGTRRVPISIIFAIGRPEVSCGTSKKCETLFRTKIAFMSHAWSGDAL